MEWFVLSKTNNIVHINNHSLYRDDGLMIVTDNRNGNDKMKKLLFKIIQDLKYDITTEIKKKKKIQYLDAEFHLTSDTVSTYLKPSP